MRSRSAAGEQVEQGAAQHREDEIRTLAECSASTDFREGLLAFAERRQPRFA